MSVAQKPRVAWPARKRAHRHTQATAEDASPFSTNWRVTMSAGETGRSRVSSRSRISGRPRRVGRAGEQAERSLQSTLNESNGSVNVCVYREAGTTTLSSYIPFSIYTLTRKQKPRRPSEEHHPFTPFYTHPQSAKMLEARLNQAQLVSSSGPALPSACRKSCRTRGCRVAAIGS